MYNTYNQGDCVKQQTDLPKPFCTNCTRVYRASTHFSLRGKKQRPMIGSMPLVQLCWPNDECSPSLSREDEQELLTYLMSEEFDKGAEEVAEVVRRRWLRRRSWRKTPSCVVWFAEKRRLHARQLTFSLSNRTRNLLLSMSFVARQQPFHLTNAPTSRFSTGRVSSINSAAALVSRWQRVFAECRLTQLSPQSSKCQSII